MIATVRVTSARRGSGQALLTYAGKTASYEVERTHEHGVETVTSRVTAGPLWVGDVGSALAELVAGAVKRGVGTEHYDLRHSADGSIVARTALVAVDTDSTAAA